MRNGSTVTVYGTAVAFSAGVTASILKDERHSIIEFIERW
jgi:hypothetical protein